MSNFSLRYSQMLGWLQLPDWWPTAKDNRQTAQPIVTQAEIQSRHLAFHCAYQRFAQEQPRWVSRRFDDEFLRRVTDAPELPSGLALAAVWDRQFGPISPMPVRCQQMVELAVVADCFLRCYQQEVFPWKLYPASFRRFYQLFITYFCHHGAVYCECNLVLPRT